MKVIQLNNSFDVKRTVSNMKIGPGAHYSHYNLLNDELLESVHHIEVDLGNKLIEPLVMSPDNKVGKLGTVREILEHVRNQNKEVVFAVNGDFFSHLGIPSGLQIVNGEVITSPSITKVLMAVKNDNSIMLTDKVEMMATIRTNSNEELHIDSINRTRNLRDTNHAFLYNSRFRESTRTPDDGLEVVISLSEVDNKLFPGKVITGYVTYIEETSDTIIENGAIVLSATGDKSKWLKEYLSIGAKVTLDISFNKGINNVRQVISGNSTLGYKLLTNGMVEEEIIDPENPYSKDRHPRTMLATKDGKLHVFIFDGRQPGYSDGITMAEGAYYLKDLGMDHAINIDGGGSTTCFIRQPGDKQPGLVNQPSDGFERDVGNALLLTSRASLSDLEKIIPFPSTQLKILTGSQVEIKLKGHDRNYNAVDLIMDKVTWSTKGNFGNLYNNGMLKAGTTPSTGKALVSYDNIVEAIDIKVTDQIASLVMNSASIVIKPGGTVNFDVSAYDKEGDIVWISPERLTWSIQGNIGTIDKKGKLHATEQSVNGKVVAQYNGVQTECTVNVGQRPFIITDFETLEDISLSKAEVVPNSVDFTRVARPQPVRFGTFAARLRYDFTRMSGISKVHINLLDEYHNIGREIQGKPYRFGIWVYGDSRCHWLRLGLADVNGQTQSLNFTEVGGLDWTGWKYVYANIPDKIAFPITLLSIYIIETNDANKNAGVIYFDKLQAEYVDLKEDVEGPKFNNFTPKYEFKYVGEDIDVSAIASDLESGIDQASIRMSINGKIVNHLYNKDSGRISYQLAPNLTDNEYRVVIEASDNAGNPSVPVADWNFKVINVED